MKIAVGPGHGPFMPTNNGMAKAGFVCGLISTLLVLLFLLYMIMSFFEGARFTPQSAFPCLLFVLCEFLTLPLSTLSIVLGARSVYDMNNGYASSTPLAKIGLVLGMISAVLFIVLNGILISQEVLHIFFGGEGGGQGDVIASLATYMFA